MPELPEVETIKRGLEKTIVGRTITGFDDRDKKVVQILKSDIVGSKIIGIERRAKIIIIVLDNNQSMIFHMKMTGQLIWEKNCGESDFCLRNRRGLPAKADQGIGLRAGGGHPDKAWLEKLPNKHTRAIFTFDDGSVLYFNDIRRFGWVKITKNLKLKTENYEILGHLGVEPLGEDLTPEYLQKMAARFPNRKIKQFILDQTIISGVGNIYADESLFEARIMPTRLAKDIKPKEWPKLIVSIKKVLEQGIKYGGSSSENFVDAFGKQGEAHEHLNVYRKTGQKCPNNCGGEVSRIVVGGRGTHFCPTCQK